MQRPTFKQEMTRAIHPSPPGAGQLSTFPIASNRHGASAAAVGRSAILQTFARIPSPAKTAAYGRSPWASPRTGQDVSAQPGHWGPFPTSCPVRDVSLCVSTRDQLGLSAASQGRVAENLRPVDAADGKISPISSAHHGMLRGFKLYAPDVSAAPPSPGSPPAQRLRQHRRWRSLEEQCTSQWIPQEYMTSKNK